MAREDRVLRTEMRGGIQRRCIRQQDPTATFAAPFEMREVANGTGGASLMFRGYACVVEHSYEMRDLIGDFTEVVAANAFQKTLAEQPDVIFRFDHEGLALARTKPGTLRLSADSTGLLCEARLNPSRSDVQTIKAAVEDGAVDEMSMAFRVVKDRWDPEFVNRRLLELNLNQGDVSLVTWAANPATAGTVSMSMRSRIITVARSKEAISLAAASTQDARRRLAKLRSRRGIAETPAEARQRRVIAEIERKLAQP